MRTLTVTTAEMKKAFMGSDPSILNCDTTFNFESSGYKLSSFLYLNHVTGKGEVGQLAFMSDEGAEAVEFAFSTFRRICGKDPPVLMVDKDFNEINIMKKVFPTSRIILCWFHVLKWWKNLLATAKSRDHEEKSNIMEAFRKLVYSHGREEFDMSLVEFYNTVGVSV